jgi:hypothetical protein
MYTRPIGVLVLILHAVLYLIVVNTIRDILCISHLRPPRWSQNGIVSLGYHATLFDV